MQSKRSRRPMSSRLKAIDVHWVDDGCDSGTIKYHNEYVLDSKKVAIFKCLMCKKEIHIQL